METQQLMIGAVMVVGGGIAGIQASLDAAAAGFKVYLVERDISIGGVMAQLDKTFPTNDCSTCLISPKLIEVARHPDIEILTQAEIDKLEGEEGRFTVTLRREPRYIDASRCNACGACSEACPVALPSTFDEGLGTRPAVFRHFPQAVPSTFAIKKFDRAPCSLTCPAGINVQGYVQLIKIGKYDEALKLILERLPLPGVFGRICPHPCEGKCRRKELDEAVAICDLKRFAADQVDLSAITPHPAAARKEKIAVIGAGPAGLSCAYQLARRGYAPTLFEALDRPGGKLRTGYPEDRLPQEVLDREIDNILRLGVSLQTNATLGRDFILDGLFDQGYQAVFLGLGWLRPSKKAPTSGQVAALAGLADWGVAVSDKDTIVVDQTTYQTSRPGVFAAGDVQTGLRIAIEAVAGGIEAAESIDRYLRGVDLKEGRETRPRLTGAENWNPIPEKEPRKPRVAPLQEKKNLEDIKESNPGYTEEQARAEASRCLNCGGCAECMQCVEACQAEAIEHQQTPGTQVLEVGALILAPGFRPFDPHLKPEYGYGRYANVITSLEFERILSATGPCGGHIRRPSDGEEPKKIAWIQCVGSRDASLGREYCSQVCCMYAAKQAIIAREHAPNVEPAIFFIDFRAQGKGFDRYYERARSEHGVRFIRSMISRVAQDPRSHNLELNYIDAADRMQTEEFDLVVLSVGLKPHPATQKLAQVCGLATDKWGFVASPPLKMVETSRKGVFACGVFQSPKDIPETVVQASAAAGAAAMLLAKARGTLLSTAEYPLERDISQEEPRIGVFVCHCGINIAGVVDVAQVSDYARTLPGVVYADHYTFSCATDSLEAMRQVIQEHRLNRVVVASCSPRTHEPLFQDNLRKAGLNKYLFEMANIRDQDSWVHQNHPDLATGKAKELVRMAVARAGVLEPLNEMPVPVDQKALVVGGGLAGLVAALTIADAGYQVYLPDLQERFGGSLAHSMRYTLEGHAVQPFFHEMVTRVETHPHIRWWDKARITSFSGHLGNFRCDLESPRGKWSVHFGAVVVATGGQEYRPSEYLYGEHPRVLTQLELEILLADRPEEIGDAPAVVMIQCVGSRSPEHPYCSRVCCGEAVKNALKIKELRPQAQIFILYRDIRTFGLKELYYQKARDLGVRFIRFEPEAGPEVASGGEGLEITVLDQNLKAPIRISADYLVLSAAIRPHPASQEIAKIFKLPADADGFFMEAHLKLRPLDFASSGFFLCGLAHGPKYLEESIAQAQGAAARAIGILAQKEMFVSGAVARVDPQKCIICLTCVRTCPFGVPRMDPAEGVMVIDPAACQGCGSCASACPRKAIEVMHHKDRQFIAKISALDAGGEMEDQAAS